MAQAATVRVHGLRQLHRALKAVDDDLKRELESELLDAGRIVQEQARSLFDEIAPRSASGMRARVRGFGRVVVEQSRRRTTGRRPDFGSLQMRRALLPALGRNRDEIEQAVESMLDRLGRSHGF